jgi:hypothetical protein
MSRGFCGCGVAGIVICGTVGRAVDCPLLGFLLVVLLGVSIVVGCWYILYSSAVTEATCSLSSWIWFVLVAWVESIAFSIHSN